MPVLEEFNELVKEFDLNGKTKKVTSRINTIQKMLSIYNNWDGEMESVDPDSFTFDELNTFLMDLEDFEEYEARQTIQEDNAISMVLSAISLQSNLISSTRQVKKEVSYI